MKKRENQFYCLQYDISNYKMLKKLGKSLNEGLQYDHDKKIWVTRDKYHGYWSPSTFLCKSYKAAKRHLNKHDEIPKGTVFILRNYHSESNRYLIKK